MNFLRFYRLIFSLIAVAALLLFSMPAFRAAGQSNAALVSDPSTGLIHIKDFKLDIVAAGIVLVSDLSVDRHGDLFATQQVSCYNVAGSLTRVNASGASSMAVIPRSQGIDHDVLSPDLFIADECYGKILRVAPTGAVSEFAHIFDETDPVIIKKRELRDAVGGIEGLAVRSDGTVYVSRRDTIFKIARDERGNASSVTVLFKFPADGDQNKLDDLAFDILPDGTTGDLFAINEVQKTASGQIIRINPDTGASSVFFTGLQKADSICAAPPSASPVTGPRHIFTVSHANGVTGMVTRISPDGVADTVAVLPAGNESFGIAVDGEGAIYISNSTAGRIYRLTPPRDVNIDIDPGSPTNSIVQGANITIPVAALSTAAFNAAEIDPATVALTSQAAKLDGKGATSTSMQDINKDGLQDLLLYVNASAFEAVEAETEAFFEARTFNGKFVRGRDSIVIVPPIWKTKWAYAVYLLMLGGIGYGLTYGAMKLRLRALQNRNERLSSEVEIRTFELKTKNDELTMAKDALERKNLQLDEKVQELTAAQQQADRIFAALAEALPGKTLDGKYRIEEIIGTGGFSVVYRAINLALESSVALKVFKPSPGNDSAENLARFKREAVSASRVDHPNVVAALDFNISPEGVAYIVMELLNGRTLAEEIKQKLKLPLERCAQILLPVCNALAKAHKAGIVHRDVKPSNIFLHRTEEGETVKVLDFGIAKMLEQSANLDLSMSETSGLIGTPAYISPERFEGEAYDGRADVYSLGVTLYLMLSGSMPYPAIGRGAMRGYNRLAVQKCIPLRERLPDMPESIEELVSRALSADPNQRPSAAEFGRELAKAAAEAIAKGDARIENGADGGKNEAEAASEEWGRIEKLFHLLCETAPEQRAEVLDKACADAPSLREEVESLLEAHEQVTEKNYLGSPIDLVAVDDLVADDAD